MNKQDIINFLNERGWKNILETNNKIIINGTGSITFILDKDGKVIKMS